MKTKTINGREYRQVVVKGIRRSDDRIQMLSKPLVFWEPVDMPPIHLEAFKGDLKGLFEQMVRDDLNRM